MSTAPTTERAAELAQTEARAAELAQAHDFETLRTMFREAARSLTRQIRHNLKNRARADRAAVAALRFERDCLESAIGLADDTYHARDCA